MPDIQLENKCAVKGKIKCIYRPKVISAKSGKRNDQTYKVVASNEITEDFTTYMKKGSLCATEKLDGTCCMINTFNGRPWLWARHDVKPNKIADKRFKAYQHLKNENIIENGNDEKYPEFSWDIKSDFKEAPEEWVPASGVERQQALPDDIGHIVGWVPVDPSLRKHLWHLSTVDLNSGIGLFLKESDDGQLKFEASQLEKFVGKTFELIGTHVNGNPYGLGCKKNPLHVLVQHGELRMSVPDIQEGTSHDDIKGWFNDHDDGGVEGIVWHAQDGKMFKLHRHHLDVRWPVPKLRLHSRPVTLEMGKFDTYQRSFTSHYEKLKIIDGNRFENITLIRFNEES